MDLSLDYLPRLPRRKDWRIGCIGAGFIMRDCHLVAYGQAGFNPVAITSRQFKNAQALAMSIKDAKEVFERCQKAGIALAVNQNMRYAQSIRAMKDILNRGYIGT